MKIFSSIILLILMGWSMTAQEKAVLNFHSFSAKTIQGETVSMEQYKGKKILVVNTASRCGLTPQYKALEKLYKEYGGDDFVIIGFPANNFLSQEPGTNEEIAAFCKENYGVTFPMMSKISVKGKDQHPIYQWLTQKNLNHKMDSKIKWNFQKYLIDEQGKLVDVAWPKEQPDSEKIVNWIIQ